MRAHSFPLKSLAFASVLLVGSLSASAQSAYFQAMTNLNPLVYFPLQETTQPPIGDVETNYGSLGPSGNAVYSGAAMSKAQSGATADGDFSVADSDAAGGFCAVPTTDPRTAVASPTFTVECWVNSAEQDRNFEGIVCKSGGNSGGIRGANNQGGWCLSQNYVAYLDTANFRGWDFHVYNGVGHEGAEVMVPFNIQNGVWYHIVATFDGANCTMYVNGTNEVAAGNAIQLPMIGSYVPDTWQPLQIGSSRNLNGNNYHGGIDEVAIYTNVLSAARIQAHFNAASSASPYSTTILADNPYMYWRMDSPGYTAPDPSSTYPVATNQGTYGSIIAALYGTASQPGVPGPQFPGLLDPNNGNQSLGVAINGIGGNNGNSANVQYGYDINGTAVFAGDAAPVIITNLSINVDPANASLLNPTNHAPFSLSIWFKANPHDWNRFQTIFGKNDSSWRLAMNGSGGIQWNPGPGGESGTPYSYDDGSWHQFVGTFDGTNVLTYVDGLKVQTASTTSTNVGSSLFPMLGDAADYLASGNNYPARNAYAQRNFSGSISQFAFFTNVLTANQISSLYNTAVPGQVPYILAQPVTGRVNPAPAFLFFGVVANGSAPLAYQWYFNATSNYSGATLLVDDGVKYAGSQSSQVTVSNLVSSDSGYYYVIVSNGSGSVTSILATLQVNYAPIITSQNPSANFSLYTGQQGTLSVTAIADTNFLWYQWYVNGAPDPLGTNATYITAPQNTAGNSFYCVVTNRFGSATSSPVAVSSLLSLPAYLTNSTFGSNLLTLGPTAYWPMHETGETPAPGSFETNYGSVGQVANGTYGDWRVNMAVLHGGINFGNAENATNNIYVLHGMQSAIAGDPDPSTHFFGNNGGQNAGYVVIPHNSPNVTIKAPFTLEAWVRPDNHPSFMVIMSAHQNTLNGGNAGGFDWLYSGGTANTFSMTVYNGNGNGSTEPKTTASYPPGSWYHVVTTFDGTNVQYYINGVADSMVDPGVGTNHTAATMNPDTWDPITIGCGRGYGANPWQGSIDEVAVYTNVLSPSDILQHYNDGTNASVHTYSNDVLADHPMYYYRMDAPAYNTPPLNTWPTLTNYGKVAINGVYTPGSVPAGGAGPSEDGVPVVGLPANTALQTDGQSMFADALNVSSFHPGNRAPITVASWMKGNPADISARNWQTMVGNGDGSWRLNMNSGNGRGNFNPNNGQDIGNSQTSGANLTINDGQWHYVVGTYDGTNSTIYVDGLVSARWTTNNNTSSANVEVFLGAYPNNTVYADSLNSVLNEAGQFGGNSGRVLAGSVCEAAFWNGTALTSNQVNSLYQSLQVAPVIERQPASATINGNTSFTNTVIVSGSGSITYQWYTNGVAKPGANSTTFIVNNAQPSDQSSNSYLVAVNAFGSATSAVWSLTVITSPPVITNDIANTNLILLPGGHTSYAIATVGLQPITYQWYLSLDGQVDNSATPISGATNSFYNLTNAQPPNQTNYYYCIASNTLGTATSHVATVDILGLPTAMYPATILADNPVGFWRLNEAPDNGAGNDGTVANDYWGGHNGIYTNASINQFPGYNVNCEPTQPSVSFGLIALSNCLVFNIPTNVDFATPSGSNGEFSVECWANGFGQTTDAGIVSKGFGGGGEEFSLDTGSNPGGGITHAFRFFVRTAAGAAPGAAATNAPDGTWHHLVGVCDESNSLVALYVDGVLSGSNTIPAGAGILGTSSTSSMKIGARSSTNAPINNFQFVGNISDVSVYNYALTPAQVLNHYYAACIAAHFVRQPASVIAGQGGTATFSAVVDGTPVVSQQWFLGSPGSGTAITGATNSTLVLPNVQAAQNGNTYYLEVVNTYNNGTPVDSVGVTLQVVSGAPQIFVDVPTNVLVPQGFTVSIPVTAYGTEPLTYQWQMGDTNGQNFVNLSDTSRITGSQSNVLTIANAQPGDAGDYQVIIANGSGSITSSVASVIVASMPVSFYVNGGGWSVHDSGNIVPAFNNGLLTLTDNGGSEARSAFFNFKQYIGAFKAFWTYQAGGNKAADGIAFVLQNDSRGAAALGGGGGSLGVSGISPSWELELNIYTGNNDGIGCGIFTNGNVGVNAIGTNVLVNSGDPIDFSLNYGNGHLALTMVDEVNTNLSFSTNINMDLTFFAGGQTAYVGFTGATGGSQATQTITNFAFVPLTSATVGRTSTNAAVITWPGFIGGYTLQQSPSLSAPNWTAVPYPDNIINSNHQVIVPTTGATNQFYRLTVPF